MGDVPPPVWNPWWAAIADRLMAVDYVRWDRFIWDGRNVFSVYGWIDREDDHADFVLVDIYLLPGKTSANVTTSSAEHSRDLVRRISKIESEEHYDCQRVEDHFGTLADLNCVRLQYCECMPSHSTAPPADADGNCVNCGKVKR